MMKNINNENVIKPWHIITKKERMQANQAVETV